MALSHTRAVNRQEVVIRTAEAMYLQEPIAPQVVIFCDRLQHRTGTGQVRPVSRDPLSQHCGAMPRCSDSGVRAQLDSAWQTGY